MYIMVFIGNKVTCYFLNISCEIPINIQIPDK